ncbi:hypothetical protein [Aquimarina algicola]|uniref:Uncharacterized protein n=1 Tax=Aquimarina algicola TaxID=2589995 RepID=A0A504JLE0_9FLAO|nr:hypothetical protein [Aquimarina algicola]TPN87391.1 hypothetical protein FHK87_07345 [Aquimarina algicola]
MLTPYNQLEDLQQELVAKKLAIRAKTTIDQAHRLLVGMNPHVKIVDKKVMLLHGTYVTLRNMLNPNK